MSYSQRPLLGPAGLPALLLPVRVATRFAVVSKSREQGRVYQAPPEGTLPTHLLVRIYPDDLHLDVNSSDYTATARLLPDRWVVTLWVEGESGRVAAQTAAGASILGDLPLVSPDEDGSADWPSDFDAACEVGMAVAVELPESARRHIALLTVVGLRDEGSGAAGKGQLIEAIDRWTLAKILSFPPPGTPTNALSSARPGYSSEGRAPVSEERSQLVSRTGGGERPSLPAGSDGELLARALGLKTALLAEIPGADALRDRDARNMIELLWPSTLGSWAENVGHLALGNAGYSGDDWQQALKAHALAHLRPGGWLPTLLLDRQPYGLLPVMVGSGDPEYDSPFNHLWREVELLRQSWLYWADYSVPRRGRGAPLETVLARGLSTRSVGVRERRMYPLNAAGSDSEYIWNNLQNPQRTRDDLDSVYPTGLGWRDTFDAKPAWHQPLAPLQRSDSPALPRFSDLMRVNRPLVALSWVSVVWERASYRTGERSFLAPTQSVAEFIAWNGLKDTLIPGTPIPTFLAELRDLEARDPAQVDRLCCETLDATAIRLDAWLSSLAVRRLRELRAERPEGILIGGYGLVEALSYTLSRDNHLPDGYILTPSRRSAAAAAILQNAADGLGADGAAPRVFQVDLTAQRAQAAEDTLSDRSAPWTDAVVDLGVAEIAARLAEGDLEGVGAVSDALFRGTGELPRRTLLEAPAAGPTLKHRLALRIPADAEPVGWSPAWPILPTLTGRARSPLATVNPALNTWLGWIFGPPGGLTLQLTRADGAQETANLAALWTDAGAAAGCPALEPIDLYALASTGRLSSWLCLRLGVAMGAKPVVAVAGLADLEGVVELLRPVLARLRPLSAEVLALDAPNSANADAASRAAGEEAVRLARAALSRVLGQTKSAIAGPRMPGIGPQLRQRAGALILQGALLTAAPTLPASPNDEAGALRELAERLSPRPIVGQVPASAEEALRLLQALFGVDLPLHLPLSTDEPALTALRTPLSTPEAQLHDWLAAVSSARPGCAALWDLLAAREALRDETTPLSAAQVLRDWASQAPWVGARDPSFTLRDDAISVVWHAPLGHAGDRVVGFLADDWFEQLPAPVQPLGLAARIDQPAQQAPQAILLGVHPTGQGSWTEGELMNLVVEAFDIARLRALAPEDIPANATFPATLLDLDAVELAL